MYKFQSDKPKKLNAVDGFLSSRPRQPSRMNINEGLTGPISRPQPGALDDFRKAEGFTGRSLPKLTTRGDFSSIDVAKQPTRFGLGKGKNTGPTTQQFVSKKPRKKLKILLRTTLVIIILVLGTGGFIFGKAWWSAHKVFRGGGSALAFQKNIDPHLLNGEGDGRVNILLLGKGGGDHPGAELTDSMMIASLDPINNGVALLSIPRDLWVNPDGLFPMKINQVYTAAKDKARQDKNNDENAVEEAGLNKVCEVVEQYLGVHMHYYGLVEFSAFEEAVNTLGGITVTLPEAYYDGSMLVGNRYLNLPAGTQQLDGGLALAYARSRYGTARGDFDRGEHQQTVLVGIKDKILSIGTFANPIKVSQLLSTFGNRVRTNLSIDDMMRMYSFSKQLNANNITHADLAQQGEAVVRTGNINNLSVVYPVAGIDNYDAVRAYVRNKLKDGYIIQENPTIAVLNGTTQAGLAQAKADELKGYGYNVTLVGDAPVRNATATQVVDNTNGTKKYTKRYLEQRYNVSAVSAINGMDLSTYQADFIVVVGP